MQQMTKHRPLAELDLLDDFLFNALLAYPEYGDSAGSSLRFFSEESSKI